jgi:hypothetical protein
MAGTYGTDAISNALSTIKIAAIANIQAVAKDGFQVSDLVAFVSSPTFQAHAKQTFDEKALIMLEAGELDAFDKIAIGWHVYLCLKDLTTEIKIAADK